MRVGNKTGAARRWRWPRIVGGVAAVLALTLAGLILWRIALAEAALRAGLAALGFENANVAIESIDLRRIRVARFAIGRELTITDLTIELDLERLGDRPVASVVIGALTLNLTRPDGALRRLLARPRPAGRAPRLATLLARRGQVPDLAIDTLRLRLPGQGGVLSLDGDVLSQGDGQGGLTTTMALRGIAALGGIRLKLEARAFLDVSDSGAGVTLHATAPQAGAVLDLGLTLDAQEATPTVRGEVAFRAADLTRLAPFLPQLAGLGGRIDIEASTTAPLPIQLDAPPDAAALLAMLRRQGGFIMRLTADALRVPPMPPVNVRARVEFSPGEARLTLDAEAVSAAATGSLALNIADPHGKAKATARATLRLGDLSQLAAFIPMAADIAGTLEAEIATTRPVALPRDARALGDWLRRGGGLTASLRADTEIAGKRLRGAIDAALDAGPDQATITLRAKAPDAGVTGGMTLTIADPRGRPTAEFQGTLDIAGLARLAGIIPALAGIDGALRLRARTMSPVALPPALPTSAAELTAVLCQGHRGSLAVEGSGLRRDGMIAGLAGTIEARLRCDKGAQASGEIDLKLTARRVGVGAISATGARLAGPLRIRWRGEDLTLEIPTALTLALAGIVTPRASTGPLRASISAGKQVALRLTPGAARADIAVRLAPLTIAVPATGAAPPIGIELTAARLAASGSLAGDLEISVNAAGAKIARGDMTLGLGAIEARATRSGRAQAVSFDATMRLDIDMAGKKLLAPLDLTLGGSFANAALAFEATATGPAGLRLSATGRHAPTKGAGAADIALARLQFGEGGADLAVLLPGRGDYAPSAGALEATAKIAWTDGKIDGSADLTVEDMRIANGDGTVTIDGLQTRLHFDRLWPPVTAPGQRLTVRRIKAGVTLDALELRFALAPGPSPTQPTIAIDEIRVGFAGGTVSARGITYDPARAANRALVRLDGIDLGALLEAAQIEGLSGTGTISGAIPVRMEGGRIAIDKGALAATGSGVLRFKSDAAKQALEAGGEYVTLALEALEDFRYRRLAFDIDKALTGEGTVRMRLEGHNPAILDAHPFAINLNVSGDVDKLAGLVARLLLLPEEIVRSIVPK